MTRTDAMADFSMQKQFSLYGIHLEFCDASAAAILQQLAQTMYDAVVIRCSLSDLTAAALIAQYKLQQQISCGHTILPAPETLFFLILPSPDASKRKMLLASGYADVLSLPLSEYRLGSAILRQINASVQRRVRMEHALYRHYHDLLIELGCPNHLRGFHYLCRCLVFLASQPDALYQLTKILYPQVARLEHTSAANLERSMRTVLEHLRRYGNQQMLAELMPNHFGADGHCRLCVSALLAALSQTAFDLQKVD